MRKARILSIIATTVFLSMWFSAQEFSISRAQTGELPAVAASFAAREVAPGERLELNLSRPLAAADGRLAVFFGHTDVSSLFLLENRTLTYQPGLFPLAAGENPVTVYLVRPNGEWKMLAEMTLKVAARNPEEPAENPTSAVSENASSGEEELFEFTPNLSLNIKGQNQTLSFPAESAPERNPFTDVAGQGSFSFKVARRGWTFGSQFDFAGTSFRQEALRFSELQDRAPRIDLSSYLIEFGKAGLFTANLGHISFGSNRHLISGFSSRGITVTVPAGKQNEFSFAAANGTAVVGFDNFLGITRRKHSLVSAAFAREFFKEQPGRLRMEFSVLRGSLLPLTNFNQGEVNDAEKSVGFGLRVTGSDARQRLRYEASFTRSRFTNPTDPNLEQDQQVTEIRPATKNARFGEISFDFIQGMKLWNEKKLKLTGTFRHEEVEPLFRSIGVFTQADRRKNQFEVSGNFGEMNFAFGNLRERDNLGDIASILKTLGRQNNAVFSIPLNSFFTPDKPIRWLPVVSYIFGRTHQFGAFLPQNGEFADASQVPDQISRTQAFNAQWTINDRLNIGFVHTRSFQDNRQPGRERADFAAASTGVTVGYKPFNSLGLDFELSRERQKSFEQLRTDRTFRLGTRAVWQIPFIKNSVFSGGFSFTLAGDTANLSDARNGELDAQWAYNFSFGEKKFKKLSGQFFIRYANRYGDTIDRQFFLNSINKAQTFNAGINFNIF